MDDVVSHYLTVGFPLLLSVSLLVDYVYINLGGRRLSFLISALGDLFLMLAGWGQTSSASLRVVIRNY